MDYGQIGNSIDYTDFPWREEGTYTPHHTPNPTTEPTPNPNWWGNSFNIVGGEGNVNNYQVLYLDTEIRVLFPKSIFRGQYSTPYPTKSKMQLKIKNNIF